VTQPESGARRWLQLLVGIAVSAAMIWYAFRETRFEDVWQQITAMRIAPMLLAVVLATLPFPLRVPRWSLLLTRPDGSTIPPQTLWHAVAIGFAANNILPFRLGEVMRMGAISRLAPVPFPSALASVAVERLLDALAAIGLLGIALLVVELPTDAGIADAATSMGLLALVALAAAVMVARWPALATAPIERVLPDSRFRSALLGVVARLANGIKALAEPALAVRAVGWSVVIWSVNAAAFWVAFAAFGIEVPFSGAIILQGALLVGIALPNAPGYAGVFETVLMLTLANLFGVDRDVALAYAISYHVLTFVPITLMGVWSALTTGLTIRKATEGAE
jgi:uncharacterized protein (TIRG00374 family)